MANNENLIPIPGRLHSVATEGHVSGANEIYDDTLQKDQATINQEVQEAIGTGGSVDSRIAAAINALDSEKSQTAGGDGLALSVTEVDGKITSISGSIAPNTYDTYGAATTAKTEVIGGATSSGNTLKKLEDRVSPLETAVGSGGSIDTRISNAVAAETAAREAADTVLDGRIDTLEDVVEDCAYIGEDDGSSVIADFDPQTDTVWKKAQTLSNADKAQVKTNLGIPQEIYSKTEVNELVSTPHQNYVTVSTYAGLPASGSTDTIYRVSNYDGTQVAAGVYSEYAWNGSDYIFLAAKSSVGEVFDISEYHAGAKYADLAAALDSNNGGGVPQSLQKGGMSVKFVSNSDNKYVQWRNMTTSFSTAESDWQGVDEEPVENSRNLVESSGVEKELSNIKEAVFGERYYTLYSGGIYPDTGQEYPANNRRRTNYIELKVGDYFVIESGFNITILYYANGQGTTPTGIVNEISTNGIYRVIFAADDNRNLDGYDNILCKPANSIIDDINTIREAFLDIEKPQVENGVYINAITGEALSADYKSSDFIAITSDIKAIRIRAKGGSPASPLFFYDSNQQPIEGLAYVSGDDDFQIFTAEIKETYKYYRFCYNYGFDYIQYKKNITLDYVNEEVRELSKTVELLSPEKENVSLLLQKNTIIIPSDYVRFSGKKIGFLGDSITSGHGNNEISYANIMCADLSMIMTKDGISGSCLTRGTYESGGYTWNTSPMCDSARYNAFPSDIDYLVLFGGVNDAIQNRSIGTIDSSDDTNIYGALNAIISSWKQNYPDAKIIIVTPMSMGGGQHETLLENIVTAIKAIGVKYSVNVCDIHNNYGLYPIYDFINSLYMLDGLHPNKDGYDMLSLIIRRFLRNV